MDRTSHCARPGCCSAPAALLGYDYANRTVWLDPPHRQGGAWALCAQHAEALTVPIGWRMEDRRLPVVHPIAV